MKKWEIRVYFVDNQLKRNDMSKVTRTYLSGCTWCGATGFVKELYFTTTGGWLQVCPVCNGSKTIIVTETYDELYEIDTDKIKDNG